MIHAGLRRICAFIAWTWLAAGLLHSTAHLVAGAPLSPLPPSLLGLGLSIEVFFSLGPLVALALLYTRWIRSGEWLLLLTMLIALLWGFFGHFLLSGDDNILAHTTTPGGPAFLLTSILVFLIPWAGVTAGLYAVIQTLQQAHTLNEARTEGQQKPETDASTSGARAHKVPFPSHVTL